MAHGAERNRKIAGHAADIGALAAIHLEDGAIGVDDVDQLQPVDKDLPGRQFDRFAGARQPVGALAAHLDRRELRRRLRDLAKEGGQGAVDFRFGGPPVAGLDERAVPVVGIARLAPANGEAVGFRPVHDERDGLGGLAQGDRQDSGGERVEGAGMAGLLRIERTTDDTDRPGRAEPDRLVDVDPAVNRPAAPPTRHRPPRPDRPARPCPAGPWPPGRRTAGRRSRWRRRRTGRRENSDAA